jgi:hypothetical protein
MGASSTAQESLIFGRNVWQRPYLESLQFVAALREILQPYPSLEPALAGSDGYGETALASD